VKNFFSRLHADEKLPDIVVVPSRMIT